MFWLVPTPRVQIGTIEQVIGVGQVEELIEHAKMELTLIPEYASWKLWEQAPATPQEDEMASLYDDLEFIDPDSVEYLGLKDLAQKKRAADEARRKAAAEAAAAAAKPAPAPAPAPAATGGAGAPPAGGAAPPPPKK
jgi:hypothetical protein